ncbi:MAG: hypothetical protein ACKV2T_04185 [Kofleriaceae bacterium]
MRCLILLTLVGCGPSASAPPPQKPAPSVPITVSIVEVPKTCTDAAFGVDRVTKDLRPPEQEIVPPLRAQCQRDVWSQKAIDCFANLVAGSPTGDSDLALCVGRLPMEQRVALVVEIKGEQPDQTAELAEVVTKLGALQVGIASCDRFVVAVTKMMDCPGLDADARIQLGNETVEAWNLPMHKVSLQDKAKLAGACTQSLESLKRHATDLACTL